jgi:hypothetical protein
LRWFAEILHEPAIGSLQKIAEIISDFVPIEIDENGKGFSKRCCLPPTGRIAPFED